ncbi:MAG: pentapeptide repeat-containing protein [Bacteroidia bacterium]|nr:pentapeptide repeat-containing protein [Bacteroidia bacterium]
MLNSNSIGNKIAIARKKLNLSQAELAQQVSISSQAVGKWERGESMPDILTLNRLAEIMGVDLNYFSESFQSADTEVTNNLPLTKEPTELKSGVQNRKLNWDMSKLNLVDSDFSGLKNLHEKFSSSNMQRCLFIGSNMSGLLLNSNNVDGCDFTDSNICNSQIQSSNLGKNIFKNCSLKETEFSKSNIQACDFSNADFTKTTFKSSNFLKNTITNARWNCTSFIEMQIQDIVFEGNFDGCFFENCAFYGVKFQNATLINTFFKNNKKFKRVQFINCKVDKITYAFLKNNQANLTGVTLLS